MRKRGFFFLPLLLVAGGMMAEPNLVPAMIVKGTDGIRQVVQLEATDVTDLLVLQTGHSLSVDIPEARISGIRSITFSMVPASDITSVEHTDAPMVRISVRLVQDF